MSSEDSGLKAIQKTRYVIWGSVVFIVFVHGFIAYQQQEYYRSSYSAQALDEINRVLNRNEASSTSTLYIVLAVFLAILSFVIPYYARKQIWDQARASKMKLLDLESRLLVPYVLAWAFSALISICGSSFSKSYHVFVYYVPFAFLTLLLLFFHRPKPVQADELGHSSP